MAMGHLRNAVHKKDSRGAAGVVVDIVTDSSVFGLSVLVVDISVVTSCFGVDGSVMSTTA